MKVFFPSCRITAGYPESSRKLREYMEKRHGLAGIGCCKEFGPKLSAQDTPVLICNNCAVELRGLGVNAEPEYVPEWIDADENFHFPNHIGLTVWVQNCDHGYRNPQMKAVVRSLLTKMKIRVLEMPETAAVPDGLAYPEHAEIVKRNGELIGSDPVVTYCPICQLTYRQAGKNTHFLLDLLFDA